MIMPHSAINTGAGWRCNRCGQTWDQGELEPDECKVTQELYQSRPLGDEYSFRVDDLAFKSVTLDPSVAGLVDPEDRFADMMIKREPTFTHKTSFDAGEVPEHMFGAPDAAVDTAGLPILTQLLDDGTPVQVRAFAAPPKEWMAGRSILDPMAVQYGGRHYKDLAIQPTEFCMRNGLDFCIGSILKYITRARAKNGVQDLQKARHFVQIRQSLALFANPPANGIDITMLEYVTRNNCRVDEAEALYRLEAYYNADTTDSETAGATRLIAAIDILINNLAAEA